MDLAIRQLNKNEKIPFVLIFPCRPVGRTGKNKDINKACKSGLFMPEQNGYIICICILTV